jgi:hypothetical protein
VGREPLITRASIIGAATAVLTLLVAFGVPLTDDQKLAILGFVGSVGVPAAIAWATHRKVTPVADPRANDGTPLVKATTGPDGAYDVTSLDDGQSPYSPGSSAKLDDL